MAVPPDAPEAVVATVSADAVSVTWEKPVVSGSFPITDYQAVVAPGGQSCLAAAPALTCTITGLTNGTAYTATVRALNGAGWGEWSASSSEVTPVAPSIVITGTRAEVRGRPGIIVSGVAQGLSPDTMVHPWFKFPGHTSYRQGTSRISIDESGELTWQRRTGKKIYISLRSADGQPLSNRLIIGRR